MSGLPAWCISKTQQSSKNPLSISPANPEGSWPLPLLPNQSKLGSPRMGLPGGDRPPTCSLTAGHCKPPCREMFCWRAIPNLWRRVPIIIHRCEDDFVKHSLFGLTQLPETVTAYLALDFKEQWKNWARAVHFWEP